MYVDMVGHAGDVVYHDASDTSDDDGGGGSECDGAASGAIRFGGRDNGRGTGPHGYLASLHDGGDTTAYGGISGRGGLGVRGAVSGYEGGSFRIAHGNDSGFAGCDEEGMADLAELALDSSGEDFMGGAYAQDKDQDQDQGRYVHRAVVLPVGEQLVPKEFIARLKEMGFPETRAVEALIASKGQLAQAAALLASTAEHAPTTTHAAAADAGVSPAMPEARQGVGEGPVPHVQKALRLPKMNLFARGRR
jgi:hypothetical protein